MLLGLFLVCFVGLCVSTVLLLTVGRRLRFSFAPLSLLLAVALAALAGEVAVRVWDPPATSVRAGQVLLIAAALVVALGRRRWNPVGQLFFASLVASAVAYLSFGAFFALFGGLSVLGALASGMLFLLELLALSISLTFAFESCDVICRTRWDRAIPQPDPSYLPKVSLQIAAYNEPPDMLIKTIASAEALDYPDFEVVVIDNN